MFVVVLRNTVCLSCRDFNTSFRCLTSEAVKSAALSFEGVHDVEGGHCLSARVLSVGDGVSDDILKEYFEYASCLLIDKA